MSKSTLRKRLSLVVISTLTAGTLSVASAPVASAHGIAIASNATNIVATQGTTNGSLFVAMRSTTTTTTVAPGATGTDAGVGVTATSRGLLAKDSSSGTAQTATALAGAVLSFYASVNTATAYTVTGGTLSNVIGGAAAQATAYAADLKSAIVTQATVTATGTGAQWTLPTTPGTYTINLLSGWVLVGATPTQPSYTVGLPPTLSGAVTVTVVAASAGGAYSAANSACNTAAGTTTYAAGVYPNGIDSSATKADGDSWSIDYSLLDAYNVAISTGALTATATNGALISFGTAGTTPTAGTTSTIVSTTPSSSTTVRVVQPTAGAPLTTTVAISFNGTVVCTKTVTIRGTVDKLTVANVGTQDLSASAGSSQWMYQEIGLMSAGLFTVLATDSAGNIVATPTTLGAYSMDSATTTPTIQGLTFPTVASSNSSTSTSRFTLGSFTCGATAGSGSPVVVFTNAGTGKITKSAPFTARCADNASTYTASFDKAVYNNGDIATLTVKFLDSKGNAAQNVTAYGASSITVPMMTAVSSASATSVTKADGTLALTYTVGLAAAAASPGTYAGVVTFTDPALGTTQALKYSIVDAAGTVSNAEVLKSIVALIASINKQIQALQKLILKR
jgi:hypothetical protein